MQRSLTPPTGACSGLFWQSHLQWYLLNLYQEVSMSSYLSVIREAFLFFPLLAMFFTIPYLLWNYHKYGAVYSLKALVVYALLLYGLTVFFLVCLPLPSRAAVAASPGVRPQLHLCAFVGDILEQQQKYGLHGLSGLLHNTAFLQVAFNVLMMVPLGMFLKWFFQCSWPKVILYSFLASLFLEVSQLTGLFGLYAKAYRTFDVDDLLANTLGGLVGAGFIYPFLRFLPTREQMDQVVYERGISISLLRRLTSIGLDGFLCFILFIVTEIFIDLPGGFLGSLVLFALGYNLFFLLLFHGQTPGMKAVQIRVVTTSGSPAPWWRLGLRCLLEAMGYGLVPAAFFDGIGQFSMADSLVHQTGILLLSALIIYGVFLLEQMLRVMIHKPLFLARWSGTRLESTVQIPEEDRIHFEN